MDKFPICIGATASYVSYGDFYESIIDLILIPGFVLCAISLAEILIAVPNHILNGKK